jgi:phosphatidylserine/phosphatidylglycerophosphate/cardiolipin synthase-like enzyme
MGTGMSVTKRFCLVLFSMLAFLLLSSTRTLAQERLCDTSFEDCRQPLWDLMDAETQGIDFSFWFIQDSSYATKLINKFNAGVQVRVLCDPRASDTYAGNQAILDQLRAAGIPMRYKLADGILHFKMMLFKGQNKVQFTGANYGPNFFVPDQPYVNYIDEAIYFTDDPAVVHSFMTKFDDLWTDTVNYGNYANITGPLTRSYATYPIDPAMNFPPSVDDSQDFYNRTAAEMNQENQKIDIIMYRITNDRYTNTTVSAVSRGIPVRLLTEQNEYRNPDRPWDAYNVDLMYNGGVQIRIRAHQGLNHEKVVMLYGLGTTIFGSSNWTGPSSNYQQENNYFTTKSWFFQWFVNQFERKWNSTTETGPFTPLPPDPPQYETPANNATAQPTNMTLAWEGGPWAHKFDIYFGTSSTPPLIAADQFIGRVDNGSAPETYTLQPLQPGTKYYWRIVSKTMANQTATGPTWSFTTAGSQNPAPGVTSISPATGTASGGTNVTITGTNFVAGATVTIGGAAATGVNVQSSTSIIATTPAHASGTVDVVVRNSDGQSGTLTGGYTYTGSTNPAPVVSGISPNSGSTGGGTSVTISGSNFLAGATVSIGGIAATGVTVSSSSSISAITPAHAAGAANVVVMNTDGQSGTLAAGFTYNSQSPPPGDIVLYAMRATVKAGNWQVVSDVTAAGGARMWNPDLGAPKIANPSPSPPDYFEMTFTANAGVPYRLWMRGKAQADSPYNDSVHVQFSDSVDSGGAAMDRIGTSSGEAYNLEDCSGCGLSGWGWQDNGWGVGVMGPLIRFASTGTHTIRIQVREDGLSLDQIVLSSSTYLNSSPGALKNDTTILGESGGGPTNPAPSVSGISPNSGATSGGTAVTISGANFLAGATVSIGGAAATNVTVESSTSITATSPAHAAGTVSLSVTNTDGQTGTLQNAFTYNQPSNPPPTVSSVSPNSGLSGGGTAVTITGSGFLAGASVSFGGAAATNVSVANSTTINATSPAHVSGSVNVVVTNSDGQTGSGTNAFTYAAAGETVLLADDFNANALDTSKWTPNNLWSGFTDASVGALEQNQRFQIGPLPQGVSGSHYNGIRSAVTYSFSGAYCYVELTQAPAVNSAADAMLTVGHDVNGFYRIYVEAGSLVLQKKIGANKTLLRTLALDPVNHKFLRIRHDPASGNVVFETAPDNGGLPGAWSSLYSEAWDSTSVPLSSIQFEIKAGTWQAESNAPGTVFFDNFRAAKP